jgi:ribosomal protein L44E
MNCEHEPKYAKGLCRNCYSRAWAKTHPKLIRAANLAWRKANPEYAKHHSRAWRLANPEKAAEDHREWAAAGLAWQKKPENAAARQARRRARKLGQTVHYTPQEWQTLKQQLDYKCVGCGLTETALNLLGRKLVGDHIIALSNGGLDCIENIQPLCHGPDGCNNKKHAQTKDYLLS